MKPPTVGRILELQKLLNSFAEIERIVHVKRHSHNVLESDTEHSYNLAITAWFVAEHFPNLNKDTILRLALAHDLVTMQSHHYLGTPVAVQHQGAAHDVDGIVGLLKK